MNKFIDVGGAAFSSQDMCWRTPSKFWHELNKEFNFVLDACALKDSALVTDNWYDSLLVPLPKFTTTFILSKYFPGADICPAGIFA